METIVADKCLVAIGTVVYTENLGKEEKGIGVDGRQVAINEHWRSIGHRQAQTLAAPVNYNAIPGVIHTYPKVGKTEEEQLKVGTIAFLVNLRVRTSMNRDDCQLETQVE